ncbi:cytochrome oxidase assembly protein ShyY1 [Actinorugispora endophytica]|uniref:SURF1-like protein n=2 Tax=Actinorugispora endophytica TaxID=1605990 RepID=A0A4R6V856_9ACTN|nr:cytochrome oxidase assembly protein ShyY1 [Actinorugispora endophytica]
MLAFHALVLLVVPSFVWLGFWQYERSVAKSVVVELQEANLASEPVPLDELGAVGADVPREDRWRSVTATGTYDPEHELLVRNRDGLDGVGLYVVTPLVTGDGSAVLVNRGWVPQPPTSTEQPEVPPAPDGEVTVTGRLQFSETPENTGIRVRDGLPEGQIMVIDVAAIAEEAPYPLYGGFVELVEQAPPSDPAPAPVPVPEVDTGMNFSYAVQWWVFTVIAIVGWVFLVRREIQDDRDGGAPPAASDPAPRSEAAV